MQSVSGLTYDYTPFYEGMRTGDCEAIENFINGQLQESISYHDSAESFYHGYLLNPWRNRGLPHLFQQGAWKRKAGYFAGAEQSAHARDDH